MRLVSSLTAALVLASTMAAGAGLNRAYLVPAYEACPGSGNCNPPVRSSPYTFDSIVLYSSPKPFTGPGKFALKLVVKGLRDAAGNPATATLSLRTGKSRITIVGLLGTLGETSPLSDEMAYPVAVKNGSGSFRYDTPDVTPPGLIANSLTSPVVYDPDGKPLATTGTQSKP